MRLAVTIVIQAGASNGIGRLKYFVSFHHRDPGHLSFPIPKSHRIR